METLPVEETLHRLLAQEDTDHDHRITVNDRGPRCFQAGATQITGTYALSNLLQELALARMAGRQELLLDATTLYENVVDRLSRSIRERCWEGLTRRMDRASIAQVAADPKFAGSSRLYLPAQDPAAWEYYRRCGLECVRQPNSVTPEFVLGLNATPGLLSLAFSQGEPLPYAVPGGRFNEMYGWDSYFMALGLLHDNRFDLAFNVLEHFCYELEHYGMILNANRTYYLTRSQPPFLTSLIRALLEACAERSWLARALGCAMTEYQNVWMNPTRLTPCGLSRYFCSGIGMPPETMMRHYGQILSPFAERAGLSVRDYRVEYEARRLGDPALDAYFREDRAVRESGHDTSYRLEGVATQLCTVDLNSLLYRYERDLARLLDDNFAGHLEGFPTSREWTERASRRRDRMTQLCWNEERAQFFDYNFEHGMQTGFESCTNLFPLWAGLATQRQADLMVAKALPLLEERGGLAGGTERSRGPVGEERTPRQWDYPYGWAPHQMLVWEGLRHYGHPREAARLSARWLAMIATNARDYNGVIAEKYDVAAASHHVMAEYVNMGAEFRWVAQEGFGWTNASFQVGQSYLNGTERAELRAVTT